MAGLHPLAKMDELGFKDGVLALRGWGCRRSAATWLIDTEISPGAVVGIFCKCIFLAFFPDRGRLCETWQMNMDMFGVWILIQALHSGSDIDNATPLSIRAEIMECEDLWCSWCLVKENLARPRPGAMQEVLDLSLLTNSSETVVLQGDLACEAILVALFIIFTQAGFERAKFFSFLEARCCLKKDGSKGSNKIAQFGRVVWVGDLDPTVQIQGW